MHLNVRKPYDFLIVTFILLLRPSDFAVVNLELMFYDRKNIQPDYELELEIVRIVFLNKGS